MKLYAKTESYKLNKIALNLVRDTLACVYSWPSWFGGISHRENKTTLITFLVYFLVLKLNDTLYNFCTISSSNLLARKLHFTFVPIEYIYCWTVSQFCHVEDFL